MIDGNRHGYELARLRELDSGGGREELKGGEERGTLLEIVEKLSFPMLSRHLSRGFQSGALGRPLSKSPWSCSTSDLTDAPSST